MAVPEMSDQTSTGGLGWIVTTRLAAVWGRVFLAGVVFAACVCTLAIQTVTTPMTYSMSRDEVLPCATHLRKVSSKGKATLNAAILVAVLAVAYGLADDQPRLAPAVHLRPGRVQPGAAVLRADRAGSDHARRPRRPAEWRQLRLHERHGFAPAEPLSAAGDKTGPLARCGAVAGLTYNPSGDPPLPLPVEREPVS
jgi:hypothetical protein